MWQRFDAAGGLGLAAIQLAQAVGAVPVATAGSTAKRAYLRDTHGLSEVTSSRSTAFADEVGPAGPGSAPHVVLNSLTSPGEASSVKLAPCNAQAVHRRCRAT